MNLERIIIKPNGTRIIESNMRTNEEYDGFNRLVTIILSGNLPNHRVLDHNFIEIPQIKVDL